MTPHALAVLGLPTGALIGASVGLLVDPGAAAVGGGAVCGSLTGLFAMTLHTLHNRVRRAGARGAALAALGPELSTPGGPSRVFETARDALDRVLTGTSAEALVLVRHESALEVIGRVGGVRGTDPVQESGAFWSTGGTPVRDPSSGGGTPVRNPSSGGVLAEPTGRRRAPVLPVQGLLDGKDQPPGGSTPADLATALVRSGYGTRPWRCWPIRGDRLFGCLLVRGRRDRLAEACAGVTALAGHVALAMTSSRLVRHDPLTELANRRTFTELVRRMVSRREGAGLGLLYLDLDDFKAVNDSLGHAAGDELLVAIADRLRGALRVQDVAARFGGDEFAVLLDGVDSEQQAREIAVRLLGVLGEPVRLGTDTVRVTASIGLVTPSGEDEVEDLLRRVDVAMYRAKSRGKARVEMFSEQEDSAGRLRYRLATEFPSALARGELSLHYQPILDLTTLTPIGFEALARWHHPDLGLVPPSEFIPMAERDGSIVEIGDWALRSALAALADWRGRHPGSGLWVSVNVSGRQLSEDQFDSRVVEALRRHGLPPAALVLEIRETSLSDNDRAAGRLERLASMGVRLAVDDFGNGHASLANLQRLPVAVIKVDRAFTLAAAADTLGHDVSTSGRRGALARAAVVIGEGLGLLTVAEGLESAEQVEALTLIGYQVGQGYHLARPMPATEVDTWLTDHCGGPGAAVRTPSATRTARG